MRKWQTITVTALATMAISTTGFAVYNATQPTHYQGETFVNEKKPSHSHNSSASSTTQSTNDSSSSTTTTTNDTSVNTSASQPASVAQEPSTKTYYEELTFRQGSVDEMLDAYGTLRPSTYVYCVQTGETTQNMPVDYAQQFIAWLYTITEGKHNMDHSLQSNYAYWLQNVKGQQ